MRAENAKIIRTAPQPPKGTNADSDRQLQLLLENLSAQSSIENEHLFQASLKLARELNALGVPLYLLSNTSARFYRFREKIEVLPLLRR